MKRRRVILSVGLIGLLAALITTSRLAPPEPVWKGHRLSEWLDFYDSSLRFETNDGRHPPFTDDEIAGALDGIGTNALPFLRRWLMAKPDRLRTWCNRRLMNLGLGRCQFAVDETSDDSLAETGFQYYGAAAQPLLPWLLELSHSADAHTRMIAYEAAFFTCPEKSVFLPLADRVLADQAANCEDMAAQWMIERFPEEAARRDLPMRFPQFQEAARTEDEVSR